MLTEPTLPPRLPGKNGTDLRYFFFFLFFFAPHLLTKCIELTHVAHILSPPSTSRQGLDGGTPANGRGEKARRRPCTYSDRGDA